MHLNERSSKEFVDIFTTVALLAYWVHDVADCKQSLALQRGSSRAELETK